ncbi:unnamed protein product [Symbiodinium natans]|uniref:Uncharacterized protein n=1 Tax=Symbiodinium natans TaxID=878477 RepID=A0A812HVX3_9DINO|nr:unnamed protein product [Symbiodinium natans]
MVARAPAALLALGLSGVQCSTNMSFEHRRLQDTYTFLTSQLHCQSCCEEEWRSCLCMLSCDIFQGECDGLAEVETCNVVRECYRRIDDASPRGFDFAWQCRLMKCISYCLRHSEVCESIRNDFIVDCNRGREGELHECDVVCSRARPSAFLPLPLAALLVILTWPHIGGLPVSWRSIRSDAGSRREGICVRVALKSPLYADTRFYVRDKVGNCRILLHAWLVMRWGWAHRAKLEL